jgi:hypothetical protein
MPAKRVSMRRIRELLRLKHACGATDRAIARSVGVARSTVALSLERAAAAGLTWPLDGLLWGLPFARTGEHVRFGDLWERQAEREAQDVPLHALSHGGV